MRERVEQLISKHFRHGSLGFQRIILEWVGGQYVDKRLNIKLFQSQEDTVESLGHCRTVAEKNCGFVIEGASNLNTLFRPNILRDRTSNLPGRNWIRIIIIASISISRCIEARQRKRREEKNHQFIYKSLEMRFNFLLPVLNLNFKPHCLSEFWF